MSICDWSYDYLSERKQFVKNRFLRLDFGMSFPSCYYLQELGADQRAKMKTEFSFFTNT